MNNNPLISVIVPVYNAGMYIRQCIDSIANQSYENIEIILVDDGSKDDSGLICDTCASGDTRIRVIHKENKGSTAARKTGIGKSTGRYVTFVDADDFIEADYIMRMYEIIIQSDADVFVGGYTMFDESGETSKGNKISSEVYTGDALEDLKSKMICTGYREFGIGPTVWGKLFKRDVLEQVYLQEPDNISIGDDAALVYPCLAICNKIVVNNDITGYKYRILGESLSHTSSISLDYFNNISSLYNYLKEVLVGADEELYSKQIQMYRVYLVYTGLGRLIKMNISNKERLEYYDNHVKDTDILNGLCDSDISFFPEKNKLIWLVNGEFRQYIAWCKAEIVWDKIKKCIRK